MRSIAVVCLLAFFAANLPQAFASGPRRLDTSLVYEPLGAPGGTSGAENPKMSTATTTTTSDGSSNEAAAASSGMGAGLIVGITVGAAAVVGVILYFALRNRGDNGSVTVSTKGAQLQGGPALIRW